MAGQQDSERELEPLIRQALRSSSASGSGCVDAEALAAWADGTLRADEASALEAHSADCARCRGMLAAFTRADAAAATGAPPPVSAPFWRRWRLPVFVPLAATAAALALYVASPQSPPVNLEREQSAAAVMEDGAGARSAAAIEPRAAPAREATSGFAAVPPPDGSIELRRVMPTAEIDEALTKSPTAADATPEPAPPPRPTSPEPSPAEAARPAVGDDTAGARGAPPAAPPARDLGGNGTAALLRARESAADTPLPVSGTDVRWRVSQGRLERAGADGVWSATVLPPDVAAAQLVSGGVARGVVWLVGSGGLVVVAPDGTRFTRAVAPTLAVLSEVEPQDARRATVTTTDGRRFTTADGGQTWTAR